MVQPMDGGVMVVVVLLRMYNFELFNYAQILFTLPLCVYNDIKATGASCTFLPDQD